MKRDPDAHISWLRSRFHVASRVAAGAFGNHALSADMLRRNVCSWRYWDPDAAFH